MIDKKILIQFTSTKVGKNTWPLFHLTNEALKMIILMKAIRWWQNFPFRAVESRT
ncbi:hypothetical protein XBI1_1260011 [Xenorhabdus bovienii str. Intermedium]|uniref:Uncharacterized protein n=1 Tax=Xenorhabdus bovienii str. Intermedium TaxID=1379677 RepID=A0A077QCZ4_XENBV|nr:hypothetical protein XBI1_1260011 [Xenorhabdus bovienii str. Intermedium]